MFKEKGFAPVLIVLLLGVALVASGSTYYLVNRSKDQVKEMVAMTQQGQASLANLPEEEPQKDLDKWQQALEKTEVPTATPTPTSTPKLTPTSKPTTIPTSKPVTTSTSSEKLTLTVSSNEPGQATMSWTLDGAGANGFKEVWAEHANPTYPEDHWNYDSSPEKRQFTFENLPSGQTIHFRVGIYGFDGKVSTYSNDAALTVK